MKAQKCPVCDGKGKLPAEFYPDTAESTLKWVECRSCNGSGIVLVQEQVEGLLEFIEEKLIEQKPEEAKEKEIEKIEEEITTEEKAEETKEEAKEHEE